MSNTLVNVTPTSQMQGQMEEMPTGVRRNTGKDRIARLQVQRVKEGSADPFKLAREFANVACRDFDGHLTLRYWRSEWYRYADGRFGRIDESTLRVEMTAFVKCHFDENRVVDQYGNVFKVSKGLITNILHALAATVAVPDDVEQPAWLGEGTVGPFIGVRNGLLDTKPDGTIGVRKSSPLWFSTTSLGTEYQQNARCARWLGFLDQALEGDAGRIGLLQEWFGYCLMPETNLHKFVVVEGEGANGKSVVLDTLTNLLGPENVSHVPLEVFGQRFQLTSTLGKLANVCAEVGEIDKVAEGFLKQFTAGDRMHFDRKHVPPVEAYPTARLILSTNVRPRLKDRSSGIWRRMIIMPFNVIVPPAEQDPHLTKKLKEELPGILNWALEGQQRVKAQEGFKIPPICREALEEYQLETNPARTFLQEHCEPKEGGSVLCSALYGNYSTWAKAGGFPPLDEKQFGKEVRRVFREAKRQRITMQGRRPYVYTGLSFVPSSLSDCYLGELVCEAKGEQ